MADLDLSKLTDGQLGALKMVGGDLTKLPDATLLDIKATLSAGEKGTAAKVADAVNTGINWAGTQFTKAGTAVMGAPRAIADTNEAIATWAGEKVGAPETGRAVGKVLRYVNPNPVAANLGPSTTQLNQTVFGTLGVPEVNAGDNPALTLKPPILDGGEVNVGKMLDVGAQAVPAAAMGGGGLLSNFLGGVTSEAAGQATQGTPWEIPARAVGALPGAWAGSKLTTPLPANLSPQQARAVALAKEMDVPLSVSQETGRGGMIERGLSRFPTSAGPFDRLAAKQGAAADRAALKTMGFEGDDVGLLTMGAAKRQAGGAFDDAIANTPKVELKPDFFNKSGAAIGTYTENTAASEIIPKVAKRLDDFFDPKLMKGGPFPELTGQQYQDFRSGMTKAVDALYSGGKNTAAKALQSVKSALDDAAEATLPAEQQAAWQEARKNYYNFKIIEKAAARGTAASRSAGTLSPTALAQELKKKQGDAFSSTTGGLNDVALVKQYLADTFPNSGTPTMQAMQGILSGGAGLGAAGMTGAAGAGLMAPGVALPIAAGLAAPNLMARGMTGGGTVSDLIRSYLVNQALPNTREAVTSAPFALAPGVLTDQRMQALLTDQRRAR